MANVILTIFNGPIVLDAPLLVAPRSAQMIAIASGLADLTSPRSGLHSAITVLFAVLFALAALTLIAAPDATVR